MWQVLEFFEIKHDTLEQLYRMFLVGQSIYLV